MTADVQGQIDRLVRATVSGAQRDLDLSDLPPDAFDGAPAAQVMIAHRGTLIASAQQGNLVMFDADGSLLDQPVPAVTDSVFDIASLTKIVVTATFLAHVEQGLIGVDDAVASYLPEFGSVEGKDGVLVRHLLTHTSGLPAIFDNFDPDISREDRIAYVLGVPLINAPGEVHNYSCVGYQTLGLLLERVTGEYLPDLIASLVTGPLGMSETTYSPDAERCAATEYQVDYSRGLVRGQVHDEAAWILGGAGNAGLFSTAADVLRFTEAIRTASGPISAQMQGWMFTDTLTAQQRTASGFGQAFGMRIGQRLFMGADREGLIGHTGFTGTSLVIDPVRELSVVLMSNRVHPDRSAFTVNALRQRIVEAAQAWVDGL